MNFIEKWFHVSPDGGSGATEATYVIAVIALVVMLIARRRLALLARWCKDRFWKK
jgi:hypothetical protein